MSSGRGSDRIVCRSGEDILDGGKGAGDLLDFRSPRTPDWVDLKKHAARVGGADLIVDGLERIFGGSGADEILGSSGDEELKGCAGTDDLRGRGDRLFGGRDSDQLDGGAGEDQLNGGKGTDTCINGASYTKCEL